MPRFLLPRNYARVVTYLEKLETDRITSIIELTKMGTSNIKGIDYDEMRLSFSGATIFYPCERYLQRMDRTLEGTTGSFSRLQDDIHKYLIPKFRRQTSVTDYSPPEKTKRNKNCFIAAHIVHAIFVYTSLYVFPIAYQCVPLEGIVLRTVIKTPEIEELINDSIVGLREKIEPLWINAVKTYAPSLLDISNIIHGEEFTQVFYEHFMFAVETSQTVGTVARSLIQAMDKLFNIIKYCLANASFTSSLQEETKFLILVHSMLGSIRYTVTWMDSRQ